MRAVSAPRQSLVANGGVGGDPVPKVPPVSIVAAPRATSSAATDSLTYVVPGKPVTWARARRRGRQHFTAPKQAAAKTSHGLLAAIALGGTRGRAAWSKDGAFAVDVVGYYKGAAVGDCDRLGSLPLDALEGLLWHDDRQVRDVRARIVTGTPERVEVTVRRMESDPVVGAKGRKR